MAGFNGNAVARTVRQSAVAVLTGSWAALHSGGSGGSELDQRQWIKIQPRGRDTIGIAINYVAKSADGTFTAPTTTAHDAIVYPTTSIIEEPIGDNIRLYGRAVQRGGSSGGFKCIVAEYA